MKFKEAYDSMDFGETIKYGNCSTGFTKSGQSSVIVWDGGDRLFYNELFIREDWYIDNKIKVTIDGKEGFISKESAAELKKMLA